MRMTRRRTMAKRSDEFSLLAGTGGVDLGEARTNHEGRKAILLIRGSILDAFWLRQACNLMIFHGYPQGSQAEAVRSGDC